MSALRLAGVGFAYPDAPPIFQDVTLELPPGWTAIVGPNGAGKSTLLRLLRGELTPTRGRVERGDLAIATVHQAPAAIPPEVAALAERWDRAACRVRARFDLDPEALARWARLSGGERQRWQVAAALVRRPDVLLLDEPTNHLDAEAREALARMLQAHRGVGVVVAHDRAFLEALVARVAWVEDGRIDVTTGGYRHALEAQRARARRREDLRGLARAESDRLARELDARRRRAEAAARSISVRTRAKGPQDSDGRSVNRKIRAANAAAQHARGVASLRGRLDEAERALGALRVDKARHRAIAIESARPAQRTVLRVELPALARGGRRLLEPTVVQLDRDSRVRLDGPNGSGKTTVLEALVERWPHPRERLLYLPQAEPDGRALLARVEALDPTTRGRALTLAAALGLSVPALRRSRAPSPGEARKLALAEGLAREVWCVALDEPTNHLDAPSIERLEEALAAYPGALLLVTHDRALADAVTHETWTVAGGRLHATSTAGE